MSNVEKRTFTLAREHAEFVDQQVASGAYASPNEVIEAGLAVLEDRQAGIEKWLREEVVPSLENLDKHPDTGMDSAEVFAAIRAKYGIVAGE